MVALSNHIMMNGQSQGGMDQSWLYGAPATEPNMPLGNFLNKASGGGGEAGHVDESKRRLAKRANEIYRTVCSELEIGKCFFHGFGAWSEFVEGRISETSFYEKAKEEGRVFAGTG
jgi:hypothetical protein